MASSTLKIYSSWRSAASWRARTALHFKGLDYECIPVNLLKGEQHSPEFRKLNPLGFVPVLVDGDVVVADSFAIIMYLEDKYPQHPLLPQDLQKKALNYQVASVVTSSMQPLQNITILSYIEEKLGSDERFSWAHNHIKRGFAALEKLLKGHAGKYATGDEIALADLFLAPQLEGSERLNIDMAEFPELKRLKDAYSDVPALRNTAPEKQPDYLDDDKCPILGL